MEKRIGLQLLIFCVFFSTQPCALSRAEGPSGECTHAVEAVLAANGEIASRLNPEPAICQALPPPAIVDPCTQFGLSSNTEYEPDTLPEFIKLDYTQSHYQPVDPTGDYALAHAAKVTPKRMFWVVSGHPEKVDEALQKRKDAQACATALFSGPPRPEARLEPEPYAPRAQDLSVVESLPLTRERKDALKRKLERGELELEGHKNPFNETKMKAMFQEIIVEEARAGIPPTRSAAGTWSQEFLDKAPWRDKFVAVTPKILLALSRGETNQYFVSDTQNALLAWILAQPQGSLTIDALFRQSYRLNGGNVYLAVLTIENVLARNWLHPRREELDVTRRLTDVTNYFGKRDNRFGSWYHFFGMMLYSLARSDTESWSVAFAERTGAKILDRRDAAQESSANVHGSSLGIYLRKLVDSGDWKKASSDPRLAAPGAYLDLDEDFRARLIKLANE